ncbi:MAG: hypothetical protein IDH49_08750 [Gammaproteobacteria bacterium]|nr:hypothetical protein [Gammaproteobacteria bacterium]
MPTDKQPHIKEDTHAAPAGDSIKFYPNNPDLRLETTRAVDKAKQKGLWHQDKTTSGFAVSSLAALTDKTAVNLLQSLYFRSAEAFWVARHPREFVLGGHKQALPRQPRPVAGDGRSRQP